MRLRGYYLITRYEGNTLADEMRSLFEYFNTPVVVDVYPDPASLGAVVAVKGYYTDETLREFNRLNLLKLYINRLKKLKSGGKYEPPDCEAD